MLMPEECSVCGHSRLNLELLVVTIWVCWEFKFLLVKVPALVGTVVAMPPGEMSVMGVALSNNIKALATVVLDVSSGSSMVVRPLIVFTLPLSDDSGDTNLELLTSLVRDGPVTFVVGSDGLGS